MAGTWKQIDFPPPVGSSARVSLPSSTDRMISSCRGRKEEYPQYFSSICCIVNVAELGDYPVDGIQYGSVNPFDNRYHLVTEFWLVRNAANLFGLGLQLFNGFDGKL